MLDRDSRGLGVLRSQTGVYWTGFYLRGRITYEVSISSIGPVGRNGTFL